MLQRLKSFLSNAAVVLSILGIITFSLFIFEEAIQMATFGTWPAQYAKDWDLVMEGADTIASINQSMKMVNYSVGWLQPLAFFSYRAYGKATDYYVASLRKKVLVNSPRCFVGRKVEFVFIPARIQPERQKVKLVNGNLSIITDSIPETQKVLVSGVVERDGDLLVIKADSVKPVR
ncbi:MAG: hypothetical protein JRJ13_06870 [Deltaproteobacteria bacterium]|nr:hypothetical protein [Deltaproteobacteria bacterium]